MLAHSKPRPTLLSVLEFVAAGPGGLRGTRVVVRRGSPFIEADLRKVSARTARAVVLLGEGAPQESDARAMRVVLWGVCLALYLIA
jgi:hypothetical protein